MTARPDKKIDPRKCQSQGCYAFPFFGWGSRWFCREHLPDDYFSHSKPRSAVAAAAGDGSKNPKEGSS